MKESDAFARFRKFRPDCATAFPPMAGGEGFGAGAPETFTPRRGAAFWQTTPSLIAAHCATAFPPMAAGEGFGARARCFFMKTDHPVSQPEELA